MLDAKLILIEGLPGAGKSTTTGYLRTQLQQNGFDCQQFLEDDDPHPIDCLNFKIKGLTEKIIPLWRNFVDRAEHEATITIIESRLWQNTAMFMYMSGCDAGEIIEFSRQIWQVLIPLSPVLFYLDQDDIRSAMQRLYTLRREAWMEATPDYPWFRSRGWDGLEGWVRFFEEWRAVEENLYRDWSGRKMKIFEPHANWPRSYHRMLDFLQVEDGR